MGEGGGGLSEEEMNLEFTPTWIVAGVCSVIVLISLLVERLLHRLGKILKKNDQKPLFEALQKVKEELMLLGFISLLLTVFQGAIQKICIPPGWANHMLPCKREELSAEGGSATKEHLSSQFLVRVFNHGGRRLLSSGEFGFEHCQKKGKVPLLSLEALHHLHIFIFVLALTHVVFSVLTMVLGGMKSVLVKLLNLLVGPKEGNNKIQKVKFPENLNKNLIQQWKHWEDEIQKDDIRTSSRKVRHVHQFEFIRDRFKGIGKDSLILSWLHSFVKQFYGSVTKSDYTTMRLGFIMTHCKSNPKFDFHKYMIRALEADFKKVAGISWYLWIFVVIFLLMNVNGWHTYFWIAFIPLFLLLALGTKLEHVIAQLAHEVAEKHSAIEGDLIVKPSDEHFWFNRPRFVLYLIHFILFQNAFEIAFFFWILTTYGFDSCIMGQVGFIVPRLVIGVIIQLLCSYSTLPLYAIVTQMGSYFKKAIFDEHVQQGLVGWAQKVKRRTAQKAGNGSASANEKPPVESSVKIEMNILAKENSRQNGAS